MISRRALFCLLALAAAAALAPASAPAQMNTAPEEQSFDYNPDAGKGVPELEKPVVETSYEDAEIVNDPVYGTVAISKHRWKNWVTRSLYLTLINIALIAVILTLSRTSEYNIIISYILCGCSMTLSFWCLLCAVLIYMLGAAAWLYVLPVALITWALGYLVLMKTKKSDISFSELKESFQKMKSAATEDSRLASVDGSPGNWAEEDFVRLR